ncbi:metallophosphoesterase [Pelagibius sp. Alg239-R121]|uniref:metallophosphoesterase family protein n=1 Tax=Pelagibius sp. Alg239-R121 TaxID=2993448 RepID=UPI0024A74511|nr:metallophosphoesterase [Pelagibius sp. Alg239-R121]
MNGQQNTGSDQGLGSLLFSFAVITDTHLNQGEDECNSPFEVNRLANRRMRHVVRDLNQRDLAFVINVGDLIHPVPAIPELYEQAAARFHEQVADLQHQLHLVPGNHDIGDKPNDWAPAAQICDAYVALWEKHFGAHYHAFDHGDCHFVIINAQIINSGLACEEEQRLWLENDLKANSGKRIFLNSHYPPYFTRPDEEENYDNIGEPGRSWMLNLLKQYDIEALFIGHVHNFWYNRYANTDCYLLPSTAFVRQDYSEMFRIKPGPDDQAGRNDKAKLGYFVVRVYEGGHLCDVIRTYGKTLDPGTPERAAVQGVMPVHPRLNPHAGFGFDMRQNWMEIVEIPPTGGLDEFDRKEVRNDYPLMALWEMGVRKLRVPLRDLMVTDACERMRMLRGQGHEFTLFSFGVPNTHTTKLILDNQDIFSAWEIGVNWEVFERIASDIGQIARQADLPVYLSRLRSIDELREEAGRYYHVINQGFLAEDYEQMEAILDREDMTGALDGFVFRLTANRRPWEAIQEAGALAAGLGVKASVHLRMCGADPAEATQDDVWAGNRIAEALFASVAQDNVSVYADTFIDNDRGYFVRNGVLDRLNNPRKAFHIVRHLNAALSQDPGPFTAGSCSIVDGGRVMSIKGMRFTFLLAVAEASRSEIRIPLPSSSRVHSVDLGTGIIHPVSYPSEAGETLMRVRDDLPILLQI